jgi:DnaJ family protein C protein 8
VLKLTTLQDEEIERIRNVFSLDAYAVLGLQPGVPEGDIKKVYRAKSLLIHPDKTKNPLAPDAFDRLKKAQSMLLDEKLRAELDENVADARMLLMREKKLTADDEETRSDEFRKEWREKTIWVIRDNEMRKQRQMKTRRRLRGRGRETTTMRGRRAESSASAAGKTSHRARSLKPRAARRKRRRSRLLDE